MIQVTSGTNMLLDHTISLFIQVDIQCNIAVRSSLLFMILLF